MKIKKIIIIFILLIFGLVNNTGGEEECVCCLIIAGQPGMPFIYSWMLSRNCTSGGQIVENKNCFDRNAPVSGNCKKPQKEEKKEEEKEQFKPGKVEVTWVTKTVSICPPGILGGGPCEYPTFQQLAERIRDFLLAISPRLLVVLLIFGGLMYLLTPFGVEEYVKKGHSYIKYAVYGYILLLLVTLIFTVISAVLGGPSPNP
jgi:hypothetical protein